MTPAERSHLAAGLAQLRLGPDYSRYAEALLSLAPDAAAPALRALRSGDHAGATRLVEQALAAAQETDA